MGQIKIEVDDNKKKLAGLTEQTEDCSRKTTVARTAITTLSSKQSTLEASSKSLKGKDLEKVKKATDKIDAELENAKNQLQISEALCTNLKEDITKVTTVIMQYQQEWKYYTQILTTVQKEIEVASKNVIKTIEEDDPKLDEEARTDKNAKNEPDKKNDKKPEKAKITKSSVDNEVKNTENAEETHVLILKSLIKELDETESTITKNVEKDAEDAGKIVEGDGEAAEEKKELEKVTRRKLR
jgi:chromosome segregation ATPase